MKRALPLVIALALASACGGGASTSDAGSGLADAGSPPPADAGSPPPADAGPPPPADAGPSTGTGTLSGNITRTARPMAGGRGNLYIAVFTEDPVTMGAGATPVANLRLDAVDMSADGASIPYTMPGIPPRAEPYFVTAFLDDNGTASTSDPSMAGPDRGDLVTIDAASFGSPRVTVASATTVNFDIVLNFNLPF